MATPHHPRRGSTAYYPRVRAKSQQGSLRSWPEVHEKAKIQAFAGYKVGMTHVEMIDYRQHSVTAGQNLMSAATIIEVPPLTVAGIRYYGSDENGLRVIYESWAEKQKDDIYRRIPLREVSESKESRQPPEVSLVDEVRLIVHTNPGMVTGIPSKTPEIFEINVSGKTIAEKIEYAASKVGKDLSFTEFSSVGHFVDVIGVTKGKGFTGHVERFGVKLLPRKNRKHRRMIGTLGPWHPDWVRNTVPQAGQMGYQQRTAHNIRILKVGTKDEADSINVKGGHVGYGLVRNDFILVHGSIPGPSKRLIKFRDAARAKGKAVQEIKLPYVSLESKQGD